MSKKKTATTMTEVWDALHDQEVPKTVDENGEVHLADEMIKSEYPPFFKTPFNHDTHADALATATVFNPDEPTLTQQHNADEVDINEIIRKFGIGIGARGGAFYEVPEDMDTRAVIDRLREAQQMFDNLPTNVRQHFENIENYVDFVEQAQARGDRKLLQDMKLIDPDPIPPQAAPAAPGAPQAPAGGLSSPPGAQAAPGAAKADTSVS